MKQAPFSTLSTFNIPTSHIDNVQKFKVYDLFEVSLFGRGTFNTVLSACTNFVSLETCLDKVTLHYQIISV